MKPWTLDYQSSGLLIALQKPETMFVFSQRAAQIPNTTSKKYAYAQTRNRNLYEINLSKLNFLVSG